MPLPSSKRAILSENEDNLDRPEASSTSTQRKKKHRRGPRTEVTPKDILPPDAVRLRKRSAKQKETDNNAETATQKKLHKALQELAVLKRQVRVKNHVLTTEIRQRSIERADGSNDEHEYESEDGMESEDPSSFVSEGVVDTTKSPPKRLARLSHKSRMMKSPQDDSGLETSHSRGRSHDCEDQPGRGSFRRGNSSPSSQGQPGLCTSGRSSPLGQLSTGTSPMRTPSPSPLHQSSPEPVHERPRSLSRNSSRQHSVVHSTENSTSLRDINRQHRPTHGRIAEKEQNPRASVPLAWHQDQREESSDHTLQRRHQQHISPEPKPYEPIGYVNPQAALRPKPSRNEYISGTKNLIIKATDLYTVRIFTVDLFPDAMTASGWAASDWMKVCNDASRCFNPQTADVHRIYKLIMNSASSKRGHLRDKIACRVADAYGLRSDTTRKDVKATNQKRVQYLQHCLREGDPPRYSYKNFESDDPEFYAEPEIILRGIQEYLFKSSSDFGIIHKDKFNPLPVPFLAAGLCMLEHGLDVWTSGARNPKLVFSEDGYKEKYNNHMKQLTKWTGIDPEAVTKVRAQLYKKIIRLAGLALPQEIVAAGFSEEARLTLELQGLLSATGRLLSLLRESEGMLLSSWRTPKPPHCAPACSRALQTSCAEPWSAPYQGERPRAPSSPEPPETPGAFVIFPDEEAPARTSSQPSPVPSTRHLSTIEESEVWYEFDSVISLHSRSHPRLAPTVSSLIVSVTQEQTDYGRVSGAGGGGRKGEGDVEWDSKMGKNTTGPWDKAKTLLMNVETFLKQALPAHVDMFLTHLYGRPTWSIHSSPRKKLAPGRYCTLRSPNNRLHVYKITGQAGTREGRLILSATPKRGGKPAFVIVNPADYNSTSTLSRLKTTLCGLMGIRHERTPQDKVEDDRTEGEETEETSTQTWSE
ncbi:hypothetical protein BC835DRAFT_1522751 [Cytidiella melzeri]|nr:hypothetical protein BC835DRAFT_1522751 [Cytidiella melzeri]